MRLTAYQPYPEADDLEGFPSWRTGLHTYADAMLLLVFEIEAWLGLLRLTYPDREDTPRFVKLIKENLRRTGILWDLGNPIQEKVRPYLEEQRRLEREQQQQGSSASASSSRVGGGGEDSNGGGPSSSSKESKKNNKKKQKKKGKKK